MHRSLTVFSNSDDSLVAEYPLHNVEIDVLQHLWDRPRDDPMVEGYVVEEWMLPALRRYMDSDIDFDAERYTYFVEATADFPGETVDVESQRHS